MNARSLLVIVLALVCGLSAVFLVNALRRPVTAPTVERTGVVFATADVQTGEMITEAGVEVRQVPVADVPEDAIRQVSDAIDRAARSTIDTGDMLRQIKLADKGAGRGMAALIKPGMRAFTIQTPSFSSSLAGFLLPGNKVDVLLTASSAGGDANTEATLTLLQDVEILAVHTNVNQPTANKINPDDARSVTLQVTPENARRLDLAQNRGTLHLTLRNPSDKGRETAGVATLADIQGLKPKVADRPEVIPLAATITPGMRAFTLDAANFSASVAGFLTAETRVDVLLTGKTEDEDKELTGGGATVTLLRDIKVLAVHPQEENPLNKSGFSDARLVTLEVKPDQAQLLDLGQSMGKLHLSLRGTQEPIDHPETEEHPRMSLASDLNLLPPRAAPTGAGPRVKDRMQVRTLRGTRVGVDSWTVYELPTPPTLAVPRDDVQLGANIRP